MAARSATFAGSDGVALPITSASNFRDVAGTGLAVPDGILATGRVYRSAMLSNLSRADRLRLTAAGVSDVIDLRTTSVATASPDASIAGATYHLVNIFAVHSRPLPRFRTVAAAKAFMRRTYTDFVVVAAQRRQLGRAMVLVAAAPGSVVIHCTEGKDRTGWIAALLQLNAGASTEQALAEYLKSNDYRAALINRKYRAALKQRGLTAAKVQKALLRVEAGYLVAGLDRIESTYGSLNSYLRDGLGLSEDTVAALRAGLLG